MADREHGSVGVRAGAGRRDLTTGAAAMYEQALLDGGRTALHLRAPTWSRALPVARWCAAADAADVAVLEAFAGTLPARADVLDLGCGPGRHAGWLRAAGHRALGVDRSAVAITLAHERGVPALRADVLGPLPGGHHGWDGALLLDGSTGIGGDPLLLLCRVRDLLRPDGRVLVELDDAGARDCGLVVLDDGRATSPAFPWARLDADGLRADARCAGFDVVAELSWPPRPSRSWPQDDHGPAPRRDRAPGAAALRRRGAVP